MVKTRRSTAENVCSHSDDEVGISAASRRRSQRLSASMNGGRRHSVELDEAVNDRDDDVTSSPDESWQETPRRSTRKLLEKSKKLYEEQQVQTSRRKRRISFDLEQKDEDDYDGRRRSGRQRSVLFDTLNVSQIGEQVLMSKSERRYHVKDRHGDMGMESDIEPYESILTRNGRSKGSKRFRTSRKQHQNSESDADNEQEEQEAEDKDKNEDESEPDSSENSKENSDDEESPSDDQTPKSYYLREHKPIVQRFTVPMETSRSSTNLFNSPARRKHYHHRTTSLSRHRRHHAHHVIDSTTSSDSSEEDERKFQRRKEKSMARSRSELLPMNMSHNDMKRGVLRDRQKVGASLADIEPMNIDRSVTFDQVGGLSKHVEALKEMLVFPLLYPEVFEKFHINPPRGVLFHGAPGTGKTLLARALANECGKSGQKVAFFMRKGADCLSKWVGESERQLRLLFDQAYTMRPSIIFFDEIDGLAPVRSTRQDQIHSSIVSTLLALMDGLDSRGEIIVIGATNRIDAIDPALRRPGRFDGEFLFPMPCQEARRQILAIHTSSWHPPITPDLLTSLTSQTVGYCGADLKGLCTEAAMFSLRRTFPQIYTTNDRLQLDVDKIEVQAQDFQRALKKTVPTARRSNLSSGRLLNSIVRPLLQSTLDEMYSRVVNLLPAVRGLSSSLMTGSAVGDAFGVCDARSDGLCFEPRMLVCGGRGMGQVRHLGPALVHLLESLPCHMMDVASLHGVGMRTAEEACVQIIREAERTAPSIIYIPDIQSIWSSTHLTFHSIFLSLVDAIPSSTTVLVLATAECPFSSLSGDLRHVFERASSAVFEVDAFDETARRSFLDEVFLELPLRLPPKPQQAVDLPSLPVAPPPPPRQLSTAEVERLEEKREQTLRELRIFLRDCTNKLIADRKFKVFTKPVDPEEAPDYYEVVTDPMDLSIIMNKIDRGEYRTSKHWLDDIDLITINCIEYNPDHQAQGKVLRHRAWGLKDFAHALITREMDSDFEELCRDLENSYQELQKSSTTSTQKAAPLTPSVTTANPPAVLDTKNSRKSLRVRGIRAETPPPLIHLKRTRRNGNGAESTPQKEQDLPCSSRDVITDTPNLDNEVVCESQDDDLQIVGEFNGSLAGAETPVSDTKHQTMASSFGTPDVLEACEVGENQTSRKSLTFSTEEDQQEVDGDDVIRPVQPDVDDDGIREVDDGVIPEVSDVSMPEVGDDVIPEVDDVIPEVVSDVVSTGCLVEACDASVVVVDQSALYGLLERAVMITGNATVSELEWLYSQLMQLVYKHRMELEKGELVRDMDECIQRFELQKKR